MASTSSAIAGPTSSRRRPLPKTLDVETAHQRHQRVYRLKQAYEHGRKAPAKPTKSELDVLKERHQFVRNSNVDPSTLSWEDQLALRYYSSLFREFALVNLKHYKTGQIALRWRTEPEVLSAIGHLTCGNLRCRYHEPSPSILSALEASTPPPEDDEQPLVEARLEETQMQFGYVEEGEKKSALVKVVLCKECGKKLRYGREKAKELQREREAGQVMVRREEGEDVRGQGRRENRRRGREEDEEEQRHAQAQRRRRRREDEEQRRSSRPGTDQDEEENDFGPCLPPDLARDPDRHRSRHDSPPSSSSTRSRRRSASPDRRRSSSHR
ncbi:hypothetical protein JCM11251_002750 [Rhodosporidiobolus azoricus]